MATILHAIVLLALTSVSAALSRPDSSSLHEFTLLNPSHLPSLSKYSPRYLTYLMQSSIAQATSALSIGDTSRAARNFAPSIALYPPDAAPTCLLSPLDKEQALGSFLRLNVSITTSITRVAFIKASELSGASEYDSGSFLENADKEGANDLKEIVSEGNYSLVDKVTLNVKARGNFIAVWQPVEKPWKPRGGDDFYLLAISRMMWTKY